MRGRRKSDALLPGCALVLVLSRRPINREGTRVVRVAAVTGAGYACEVLIRWKRASSISLGDSKSLLRGRSWSGCLASDAYAMFSLKVLTCARNLENTSRRRQESDTPAASTSPARIRVIRVRPSIPMVVVSEVFDGAFEGSRDGGEDGALEGSGEGVIEGCSEEGARDGEPEGAREAAEGSPVGPAVGSTCLADGWEVGSDDGVPEKCKVGEDEGVPDGASDDNEEECDGDEVGSDEGTPEGGASIGTTVGRAVCTIVGRSVGSPEGTAVGSPEGTRI